MAEAAEGSEPGPAVLPLPAPCPLPLPAIRYGKGRSRYFPKSGLLFFPVYFASRGCLK